MHPCLYISEILHEILEYSAAEGLTPMVQLARTCRLFREPALNIIWRELDDFSPLVKCMPQGTWIEEEGISDGAKTVTLRFKRMPTRADWRFMYTHASRVRKITFCQQRYTDAGFIYRIDWTALSLLSHHVATARCLPGPFLPNLRALHFDYYERYPGLFLADCFPHLAGRSLAEVHLHCDDDFGPEVLQFVDFSLVLPVVAAVSPQLKHVTIWDSRNYPTNRSSPGISGLLAGARGLEHFTCSLPMRNHDIGQLSGQQALSFLSIALFADNNDGQSFPPAVRSSPAFPSLETLILQVTHIDLATAFIGLLDSRRLRKLRIAAPMWYDESELQSCFKAVAQHLNLQELAIAVVNTRATPTDAGLGAQCTVGASTLALLFGLREMLAFSLSARDRARFETDLDDAGVEAMAKSWRMLRSLSIVQGSWAMAGMPLPHTRITMKGMLALRDHCPHLSGLSIGLDTTSFDAAVQQAAVSGGEAGHALRKLNIDSRSTPVSNTAIAAMILHGLFPQLNTIHDGSSMAWNEKRSDWQEVGGILRELNNAHAVEPSEYEYYADSEVE